MSFTLDAKTSPEELILIARLHLETVQQSFEIRSPNHKALHEVRAQAITELYTAINELALKVKHPTLRRVK